MIKDAVIDPSIGWEQSERVQDQACRNFRDSTNNARAGRGCEIEGFQGLDRWFIRDTETGPEQQVVAFFLLQCPPPKMLASTRRASIRATIATSNAQ